MNMKVILVSGLTFVVLVCAVLTLLWKVSRPTITPRTNNMCLTDKLGTLQCGPLEIKITEYVERVVQEKQDELEKHSRLAENEVRNQMIFIKLIGTELPNKNYDKKEDGMTLIREWQPDKDMLEHGEFRSNHMSYTNGHITVPLNGRYFVHSFIEFVVPPDFSNGVFSATDFRVQIKHSIFRSCKLEKEDTEVMSNIETYLVIDNESLYVGGSQVSSLVKMEAGDKLSIRLSNMTFFHNSKNNEFTVRLVEYI
ncbi:uncharacterized protein LOC132730937 [Ruditapes philippinarum]|uniref:uncharacterized protein LOC132730937 n=1 Tax=Ruditapes philippinarum TaxID=129788 RepID=UPI00295B2762|nr:uncharacterized protein LOC132730937 [Ruditapes philippinarum]XP_060573004.1 uncharacterized protein LOC132730937 [Ruditapes philippinarum]